MSTTVMPAIRTTILSSVEELERISSEWEALRGRCPTATPFQSPAWIIPWWHAFGRGRLAVLCLWAGTRLAGLVPLQLDRDIRLVGTGNTDHLDALYETVAGGQIRDAVERFVDGADRATGAVSFEQLPLSSPLLDLHVAGRIERTEGAPCPVLPLGGATSLSDALPAHFGRRVVVEQRRARRRGIQAERAAGVEHALQIFDEVVALHAAAWNARGEPGVLADGSVQAFHRGVIGRAQPLGLTDLWRLRLEGRTIAAYYGLRDRRRAYSYLSGFDPAFARISPGTLLLANVVEGALERGATALDFLRGQEPYKYRWGARDELTAAVRVTP